MEYVDVVNQKDETIGSASREDAHSQALIHRVVAIFVFAPDGKMYVQKRKDNGNLDHSIGGHVGMGESYEQAAEREADEEMRIILTPKKLSHVLADERKFGKPVMHMFGIFEHTVDTNWKFVPTEEVDEVIPMSIQEVVDSMNKKPQLFSAGFLFTMQEYLKIKKIQPS